MKNYFVKNYMKKLLIGVFMKKMIFLALIVFLFILPSLLFSGEIGNIAGKVYAQNTGDPLFQANVFLKDLNTGMLTNEYGSFIMKNIPIGIHTVIVSYMGYEKLSETVEVKPNLTTTITFSLKMKTVSITGITVTATRAVKRETPIAFTDIGKAEIEDKYTTQDMPMLLEDVPGLFANSTGIGEAQITMRGFEADKIQILINGIPVNDPESQKVYWSNWTGLSSTVKSVQVQRGAGTSLYGSGAFGGSINIETIGSSPQKRWVFRSSVGSYYTDSKVANGEGDITSYIPLNYNAALRYESGILFDGKFNFSVMAERKAGDSYVVGTGYNGYSVGAETQNIIGGHTINSSFIVAPQEHNNVYFKSDPKLFDTLGRDYNRNNTPDQKNYYSKPQFSIRDEWKISDNQLLMTNTFLTKGNGGGKYLSQSIFNVDNGDITFMPLHTEHNEDINFGKHAYYIYQLTDSLLIFDGFNPSDSNYYNYPTYRGKIITSAADLFSPPTTYSYTWLNDQISNHFQWGLNTYYKHEINPDFTFVLGGEFRYWKADHIGKRRDFRYFNSDTDSLGVYSIFQNNYDETSTVNNISGFARINLKPIENMNIMLDAQLASYNSKVDENPIQIYDISTGEPTSYFFYSTKNSTVTDTAGNKILKFTADDYKKTYNFFSPKFGVNYNISEYFNIMTNYSISYKEPKTMQWYSGYDGPNGNQMYTVQLVDSLHNEYKEEHFYGELKPEKINTIEFGVGYDGAIIDLNANYYISDYKDKIEYVTIPVKNYQWDAQGDSIQSYMVDESLILNAGEARHQGLELSSKIKYYDFDFSTSLTLAQFRWTKMNIEKIFDTSAEDMKGKVVPFSPEKMFNCSAGYTFHNLPLNGKLRIGINAEWWDDYYANYTNEYTYHTTDTSYVKTTKLPPVYNIGSSIKYSFEFFGKEATLRFDFNNILNRKENYSSANVRADYNRKKMNDDGDLVDDYLTGVDYLYVTPAPLFNMFCTIEIKF